MNKEREIDSVLYALFPKSNMMTEEEVVDRILDMLFPPIKTIKSCVSEKQKTKITDEN